MRIFSLSLCVVLLLSCNKKDALFKYQEKELLTVADSFNISATFPPPNILQAKKRGKWIGVVFYDEDQNSDKFGIYDLNTKVFWEYPKGKEKLPPLYNIKGISLSEKEISLIGGQIEIIKLNFQAQELNRFKINHGKPYFWADKAFFDLWGNNFLTSLAIPPIENFPGLISFVKNGKPNRFVGEIPSYLSEQNVFRDYPQYLAYRLNNKLYLKLQFDTLLYEYDLNTEYKKTIALPKPLNFQSNVISHKIESETYVSDILGIKNKNSHYVWLKVYDSAIFFIYVDYTRDNKPTYTLYAYSPQKKIVFYQNITNIIKDDIYFEDEELFSITKDNQLLEYRLIE